MINKFQKRYSLLVLILGLSFNYMFCQPEIFYNKAFSGQQISSKYLDYLRGGEVMKIIEKRGARKNVIEFDTSENQIVLTEKIFNIRNSNVVFHFTNDYLLESIKTSGNTFFKYNSVFSYVNKKDTLFAYNVSHGDSLLVAKITSLRENSILVHQHVLGPDGNMDQYLTIRSIYDSSDRLIKQTVVDTTHYNNRTLVFTGEYNEQGDLATERVYSQYHNNKPSEVVAQYSYVYNKEGFWRKKHGALDGGKEKLVAKRRYWFY